MSKVSVIIPVYNTEKYLPKCLDSVCHQTLSDIEIICVNDCSADNSLGILKEYQKHDDRIRIIDFKENRGVAVARNNGIKAAGGEYIGFVDSDDYIDLNFYEKLYTTAIEENSDMAKANILFCRDGSDTEDKYYDIDPVLENKLFFEYSVSAVYKASFIKNKNIEFPANIIRNEDSYFETKSAIFANKIPVVKDVFYHYYQRSTSVSHAEFLSLEDIKNLAKAQELIINLINDQVNNVEDYKVLIRRRLVFLSLYCMKKELSEESKKYISDSEQKFKNLVKYKSILPELERINRVLLINQKARLSRTGKI